MPSAESSRIIVLHQTKYSDHSLIIHAIDSGLGRQGFILRGAGRKSGGRAISEFHCLNVLDVISSGKPESGLRYLREWDPVRPLTNIRSDLLKSSVALFIGELLYRSLTAGASDGALFEWLCSAIGRLDSADEGVANFHLWFIVRYCERMGFRPSESPEPEDIFTPGETSLLRAIVSRPFEEVMALPLNGSLRRSFSSKMVKYLSYHLGVTLNVRSLDVLHELFV